MFPLAFHGEVNHGETRVMGLLCGESRMILMSTVFDWSNRVTDRQTDGHHTVSDAFWDTGCTCPHFCNLYWTIFSARQHICYSALYAIARYSIVQYKSEERCNLYLNMHQKLCGGRAPPGHDGGVYKFTTLPLGLIPCNWIYGIGPQRMGKGREGRGKWKGRKGRKIRKKRNEGRGVVPTRNWSGCATGCGSITL